MSPRIPSGERARRVRSVLIRVLWMNAAVVGIKLAAFAAAGALSILAEVLHSSLDAVNNLFALWFADVAGREPDERHPYGHQKFETLGALALVGLLSVTVFELLRGALARLAAPEPPPVDASPLVLALMIFGLLAGLAITTYEARRGRALGSDLLLADAAHTRSDVFTMLGVLAGLGLVRFGYPRADALVTLAVAGAIAWTGWRIVRDAVPVLVDERAVPPDRIRALAEVDPRVLSCYRIRSRGRPGEIFAELTIAVPAGMEVAESHGVADDVEARVSSALGAREVVVHVEPGERG